VEFTLKINLDNDEAATAGPEVVLPDYLANVAARARNGYKTGMVRDGNGVTIGAWQISEH